MNTEEKEELIQALTIAFAVSRGQYREHAHRSNVAEKERQDFLRNNFAQQQKIQQLIEKAGV